MNSTGEKLFLIHCNNCFICRKDNPSRKFVISKCRHVLCSNCITTVCPVCSRHYEAIRIDANMPAALAELFVDPTKIYERYQKTMKFQIEQGNLLGNYYVNMRTLDMKTLRTDLLGMKKLDLKIRTDLAKERERIKKLDNYIEYHKQQGQNSFSASSHPSTPTMSESRRGNSTLSTSTDVVVLDTQKTKRSRHSKH